MKFNKYLKMFTVASLVLTSVLAFSGCGNKKDSNIIKVGTSADFPPYEYIENGEITGLEIELVKKIGEKLGKKVEIKNMDFDGVLSSLTSGKVDLGVAAISITDDRKMKLDFTDKMISNNVIIVQRKDSNFQKIDDLKNIKIGFQIGTTVQEFIDENLSSNNITPSGYKDYIQPLTDLENKKLDCVIMDQVPATKMLVNKDNLKISNLPLYSDEYAFAMKKDSNPELIKKMNEVLKEMKNNGEYDKLLNKYYK